MTITADKDTLRRDRRELEQALREAGAVFKGRLIGCPFHEDQHPSGGVYQGEDGAWRFKCQATSCGFCGDVFDVRAKAGGKPVEDQLRELRPDQREAAAPPAEKPKPTRVFARIEDIRQSMAAYTSVEAMHVYTNPDTGTAELVVVRSRDGEGKKSFTQYHADVGGLVIGAPPKPWPLYNRTRLRSADTVVVVEGEKCVEAMAKIGIVATTSPCGAGKAASADWSPLAGKTVYLWPDADAPDPKTGKRTGIEHMREVAEIVRQLSPAPTVYWFDCDALNLPPKGDVVDFLATLSDGEDQAEAVWLVLREQSEGMGASAEVEQRIVDTIAGRWCAIPWPYPVLSLFSKALFPGTATLVCGDPGSTKSFLMLECFRYWHEQGRRVALYEMEDRRQDHMMRVLAQIANESRILDDDWTRANPEDARAIFEGYRARLESFGAVLTSPPEKHPTTDDLAAWVEARCADGCEIIGIDPITYADFSDRPYQDDRRFLWRSQQAIKRSGARLIIVTHPRKGQKAGSGSMDDLSGGAAYPRHAQTILWVSRKDPATFAKVQSNIGVATVKINRVVKISKARHGRGHGSSIGFVFDHKTVRFAEQGLVLKQDVEPEIV
jgi:hypothetical protein